MLALIDKYQTERPGADLLPRSFAFGDELLRSLSEGARYDLFLLDILMPGISGIELAEKIRAADADAALVFLTSSADYALDAFGVSAIQYILKPISAEVLFPVLDKIFAGRKHEKESFILVSTPERNVKIPLASIVHVELVGRSQQFYLENGKILISRSVRMPFCQAMEPLLKDRRFLHAHKSYILNMSHVEELGQGAFKMKSGSIIPIPRYKYAWAKSEYFTWLSDQGVHL